MSDTPPNESPPIDVERVHADHAAWLATMDAENPKSLYFRKPDAARRARDEAELQHAALLIRHGIEPPKPRTPQSIAEEDFNRTWQFTETEPNFVTELATKADAAAAAMSKEAREAAAAAIQRDAGEQRYAELAAAGHIPSGSKAHFVQIEGQRRYEELVRQAEAMLKPGEKLSAGTLVDGHLLVLRAAHGRAVARREADRTRMRR